MSYSNIGNLRILLNAIQKNEWISCWGSFYGNTHYNMLNLIHYEISKPRLIRNSVILIIYIICASTDTHTYIHTHIFTNTTIHTRNHKRAHKSIGESKKQKRKTWKHGNIAWFKFLFFQIFICLNTFSSTRGLHS